MRQFFKQREGATIIEFALVAPIFFLLLGAIVEYGLYTFHSVAIESAVMQAARAASLGKSKASTGPCASTNDRVQFIQCMVRDKTSALINADSITIRTALVSQGGIQSSIAPDICMTDPATTGSTCPPGTPWLEVNGTTGYQGAGSMDVNSMGVGGDLVEIRVYYPWKVLIPFMKPFFGCKGDQNQDGCKQGYAMITSATVLKNEPFDGGSSSSSTSSSSSSSSSSSTSSTSSTGGTSTSSTGGTSASSTGGTSSTSSTGGTSTSSTGGTSASSTGGTSAGGCFTGETPVLMADGSIKRIERLAVGDVVKGRDGNNKVLAIPTRIHEGALYSINGSTAFVTAGHPFWTNEGWKAIDPSQTPIERHSVKVTKLGTGDILLRADGVSVTVDSIVERLQSEPLTVYNPVMDGDHTYYANRFLVHNKACRDCGIFDSPALE